MNQNVQSRAQFHQNTETMDTKKHQTRQVSGAREPMISAANRLPAYLASLGMSEGQPISQYDKDCRAEENQDGADKPSLELPEFIRQMQGISLDQTDGSGSGSEVADPTLVFALWRLQYWMDSDGGRQMQYAEVQQDFAAIDDWLSSPPIRRSPMPVARLESPRVTSWVRSLLDTAISVRVAAVHTYRRLVMQA
ncbi:MAG: hypothetical protein GY807_06010 [Gammaproteobacteria bacterium]|nr:hypothetical protein [Gammaproteobacteria bacterium]